MPDTPSPSIPRLPPAPPKVTPPPPPPPQPHLAAGRTIAAYHQYASTQPASKTGWPVNVRTVGGWARLGCALLEGVLMIVTLGIGWLIWAMITVGRGQTPAKKLLNYRVISSDSLRPVGFGRMFFMRYLVAGLIAQIAIVFTLGILLFMPFWDSKRQNLWDKLSNTYVVHDPDDAWAGQANLH